jgi:hypothetical protein
MNLLDGSDEASLIFADWLEDQGKEALAQEIRESVLEPEVNQFCFEFKILNNKAGNQGAFTYAVGTGMGGNHIGSRANPGVGGVNNTMDTVGSGIGIGKVGKD